MFWLVPTLECFGYFFLRSVGNAVTPAIAAPTPIINVSCRTPLLPTPTPMEDLVSESYLVVAYDLLIEENLVKQAACRGLQETSIEAYG